MKRRTLLLAKKGQEFDDADWSQGENMHLKMAKCEKSCRVQFEKETYLLDLLKDWRHETTKIRQ